MRIKFWGVRGSTPTPERRNSRYGGNTPCVEVRLANGTLIIFDCGTGLRALGNSLLRELGQQPIHAYLFLTHFHWDHIQGIPFFAPFYQSGNVFLFHSVMRKGADLQAAIEDQMASPYFPVGMDAMASTRHFFDLDEAPINVNGAIISSVPLNHPQGCVAYRVSADGGTFVLATDTEPGSQPHDEALRSFVRDADVMVYDAQFTPEQLRGEKKGWGHSSWLEGVNISSECGVKQLILFHHDPNSEDAFVDGLVQRAQQTFPNVIGAAEGLEMEVTEGAHPRNRPPASLERRGERRYHVELPVKLAWKSPDGGIFQYEGTSKDISASGIQITAPLDAPENGPLEVEMILPDEITHQGDVAVHFTAMPLRREFTNEAAGDPSRALRISARRSPQEEKSVGKVAAFASRKK